MPASQPPTQERPVAVVTPKAGLCKRVAKHMELRMPYLPSLADDAVSYAAFVAGVYALMNRVVEGHGIIIAEDKVDAGGTRPTQLGYAGIATMLTPEV